MRQNLIQFVGIAMIALSIAHSACGQVLEPPTKLLPEEQQAITVEGIVVDCKKYSFTIQSDEDQIDIHVGRGAKFVLKLTKPLLNLKAGEITTEIASVEHAADDEANPVSARAVYRLPSPLIIRTVFDHARQKNRIMSSDVKRVNDYVLMSQWPVKEPESGEDLALVGEIKQALPGRNRFEVAIGDQVATVVLGQQNARLEGFSILELVPGSSRVKVSGHGSKVRLTAQEIEFWPIKNPQQNPPRNADQ